MSSPDSESPRPSPQSRQSSAPFYHRKSCQHSAKCGRARAANKRSRNEHRKVAIVEMRDIRGIRHGFQCCRAVAKCVRSRSTRALYAAGQRQLDCRVKAAMC